MNSPQKHLTNKKVLLVNKITQEAKVSGSEIYLFSKHITFSAVRIIPAGAGYTAIQTLGLFIF